jgi:iron complex outermembrane receptor protein
MHKPSCICVRLLALLTRVGGTAAVISVPLEHAGPTQLSREALMHAAVTSVSKKRERRTAVLAAVYVITQEDLRRSGVTSIAEALCLAPGVPVAHILDPSTGPAIEGGSPHW